MRILVLAVIAVRTGSRRRRRRVIRALPAATCRTVRLPYLCIGSTVVSCLARFTIDPARTTEAEWTALLRDQLRAPPRWPTRWWTSAVASKLSPRRSRQATWRRPVHDQPQDQSRGDCHAPSGVPPPHHPPGVRSVTATASRPILYSPTGSSPRRSRRGLALRRPAVARIGTAGADVPAPLRTSTRSTEIPASPASPVGRQSSVVSPR